MNNNQQKSVKVVVLGDIGRSPRMQYHALSLADNGLKVNLIGYTDSKPLIEVLEHENIEITKLVPLIFNRGPRLIQYFLKAFWQAISLLLTLCITGKSDYLLCQNPPAIPTLPVCKIYCLFTRTKFIIDWHNYAYSIMALSLSSNHILLKTSRMIEKYFGQSSNCNFVVTSAMKLDLFKNWDITSTVLYDRPPKIFRPLSLSEKHDWFVKIGQQYPEFSCSGREQLNLPTELQRTAFTQKSGDKVEQREDRPGILFSSTSWTADEDFGILMEALQEYEKAYEKAKLPKLICVITGKGPMKDHYLTVVKSRNWRHVKVVTPWLEAADYPLMVGSADLGVCLHTSSSGLDLPMKVVDMFGTGLPVCAMEFQCINELVQNEINGYTFRNYRELSKLVIQWFDGFPNNQEQNEIASKMRDNLVKFQEFRWEDNWNLRVKKFFE